MSELPRWAYEIIEPDRVNDTGDGILSSSVDDGDGGIAYYKSIDGAHMHERAAVTYAMSTLDTATYREYLEAIRPPSRDALIVDVGGGDGRNAWPWLEWGYKRVVVVDPIPSGLLRFRARVAELHPEYLDNLLLIEADARSLPLISGCADRVQAVESLYYLNEAYEQGLRECARLLAPSGQLLISERDYEGGLLTSLLYGGVHDWLDQSQTRDVWDGVSGLRVRSRCFTAQELEDVFTQNQLKIVSHRGMSAFALFLGYLRASGKLDSQDASRLDEVHTLLSQLANTGSMRRCHVVIAEK